MQPTFNPFDEHNRLTNDFVFLLPITQYDIKRGQIVGLISPLDPNERLSKRVIALEGDTVENRIKQRVIVPVGHCWVEGDNRSQSIDSNMFGPVSVRLIKAKCVLIVWPPKWWKKLDICLPNHKQLLKRVYVLRH